MTIEEIISGMQRAWNAGDGAGWGAHFAEDADFVDAVGRIQRGREVIGSEHQKIFDTIYQGSVLEIRLVDSRPLGDGLLLVHTDSTLQVPAGPRKGTVDGVQTKLIRDGLIHAFHNTVRGDLATFTKHDPALASRSPLDWKS
ncbi:SgcJ/EcaC family oxidoreductase [Amycolatopsis sp. YIM 10]|uniref:SgcJ/EcaC family oxidoreductase n=1 Tax=Amycolatopsis sp. YIM 10 TaxID=2653857 RepID=UPI0012907F6E|nr:SgcJ/EcaC family oxidoreductase [Amycolatopsis sp. YIM 10]QFU88221.1 SnoaL-like domain protein [Amycolatopsis sp. YIM 10]